MRINISAILPIVVAGSLFHSSVVARVIPVQGNQRAEIEVSEPVSSILHIRGNTESGLRERVAPSHQDDIAWPDAVEAGKRNRQKLNAVLGTQTADSAVDPWQQNYEDRGRETSASLKSFFPPKVYELLGFDKNSNDCVRRKIYSKLRPADLTKKQWGPVAENMFCPKQEIIFALSNFRNQDGTPENSQLSPTEIMLQNWVEEAKGEEVSGLKWIVRTGIINTGTKNTIKEAQKKIGAKEKETAHFTVSKHPEAFNALSGTKNVRGIYPTLANHHMLLDDLQVTDIYTYYEGGSYFVVTKLDHHRK